jgi:hypothetical protein
MKTEAGITSIALYLVAHLNILLISSPEGFRLENAGNKAVVIGSASNRMAVVMMTATLKLPIMELVARALSTPVIFMIVSILNALTMMELITPRPIFSEYSLINEDAMLDLATCTRIARFD